MLIWRSRLKNNSPIRDLSTCSGSSRRGVPQPHFHSPTQRLRELRVSAPPLALHFQQSSATSTPAERPTIASGAVVAASKTRRSTARDIYLRLGVRGSAPSSQSLCGSPSGCHCRCPPDEWHDTSLILVWKRWLLLCFSMTRSSVAGGGPRLTPAPARAQSRRRVSVHCTAGVPVGKTGDPLRCGEYLFRRESSVAEVSMPRECDGCKGL